LKKLMTGKCAVLLLAVFLLLESASAAFAAGGETSVPAYNAPNVLFLSSYSPDWYEVAMQMQGLRNALEGSTNRQFVFMDTKHVGIREAEQNTYAHLAVLCRETRFDAAVIGDDAALDFALKYQDTFFPNTPLVFMGINSIEKAQEAAQQPLITGTAEVFPLKQTISLALSLLPKAARVLSITDGTDSSDGYLGQLEQIRPDFPALSFENLDCSRLSRKEIADRLAACGSDTILLYLIMSRDGEGHVYNVKQAASFLSESAGVPIFRADEAGIGSGFFGGCVISYLQMGEQAGETVRDILNGASPHGTDVNPAQTRNEFDYAQLKRFGISESALPKGSSIVNRPVSYWQENRQTLIPAGIIIAILLVMLVILQFNYRKREFLQQKLQESRKLYKTAANSADLVIWEYDPASRLITMSFDSDYTKYVCQIRGFSQVLENGPETQAAVIFEEDRPGLLEMYRQIDSGAGTAECTYGFLWNGVPSYRRAKATAICDERTGRRTAVCISRDITNEKRMQTLYEKELQYLHQSNDAALTSKGHFDLTEGTVLEFSLLIDADVKYPASIMFDGLLNSFLLNIDREEDRASLAELASRKTLIRKYHEGERHLTFRYRRSKRGQAPGWVELQANTFLAPSSGHIECFMYSYDVTEQELEKLIISKLIGFGYENLGFLYPDTHAATAYLLNEPGAGQRSLSTLDYDSTLRMVLTKTPTLEQTQTLLAALRLETVTEQLERQKDYIYAFTVQLSEQQTARKQFVFSWLDQRRDTIFFCLSDITAQYETAQRQIQELSAAKLAAVRANEAKSAFLSSMSHDLRTPLNGILGFTDLALKEPDSARKQEYLEKVRLSGELLLNLVNDTLDLSRIESGKMKLELEDTDSRSFLQAVLAAVHPIAEQKKIRLIAEVEQCPCGTIYIDRLKLQRVILNLLANAIKYTPEGGTVRFSAENISAPGSAMTRRFVVEDNGIGISPEFLPQLFEPYAQEQRPEAANVQGTGLGLSIVKRIVDLMGGRIEVKSEVNRGSRFTVELPVVCRAAAAAERKAAEAAPLRLAGRRVLLVEDNYLNAEIAALQLRDRGVLVTLAENGKLGAERFLQSPPGSFDAILMDIRMPVLNGLEATRQIRAAGHPDARTIPILAMSAEAFEEDVRRAREAGMDDYLTKPIEPEKLYAVLSRAILQGRQSG
jgi:signal transduction histidine kinase/CheY-like chemotaxis protein/PAS domain-containing protein